MNAIQNSFFQLSFTISEQKELGKQKEQKASILKIFSFLRSEDRKQADKVCRDWYQLLHPQINCVRLLELMEACDSELDNQDDHSLKRLAGMISDMRIKLTLQYDDASSTSAKIFENGYQMFAEKYSLAFPAVQWSKSLFETHRFSKLLKYITLLEKIDGKAPFSCLRRKPPDDKEKRQIQIELINHLITSDHLPTAVDTFLGMKLPDKELSLKLIQLSRKSEEYDLAIKVAKKMDKLYPVISDIISELTRSDKFNQALDLIHENDQETNAARLLLIVSSNLDSWAFYKLSNEQAKTIVDGMKKISFACTKDPHGFRDSREDLMEFLVDKLLERGMSDEAIQVFRMLDPEMRFSSKRFVILKKIQQYYAQKGLSCDL
jgi:hypothetical protein